MLTPEQLLKIEQDVREFNESTLSGMCLPITGEDETELVKMARRYLWLRDNVLVDGQINDELYVAVDSPLWPGKWALVGEELDQAIDSAINSQRKEGGEG